MRPIVALGYPGLLQGQVELPMPWWLNWVKDEYDDHDDDKHADAADDDDDDGCDADSDDDSDQMADAGDDDDGNAAYECLCW